MGLTAKVDRAVVAGSDIADGLWVSTPAGSSSSYDEELVRVDATAVETAVNALVRASSVEPVLDRLARRAFVAPGFGPGTSQQKQRHVILGDQASAVEMLMASIRLDLPDPEALVRTWKGLLETPDLRITHAFWATAFLLTEKLGDPVRRTESLVAALHEGSSRLDHGTELAWWESLADPGPERPPRYELRAFLDAGSGVLVWSGNDAARERFDYPVMHEDLPISKSLADRIGHLLDWYDEGSGLLRSDSKAFASDEYGAFMRSYRAVVAELAWQLGSAYVVHNEQR